MPIFEFRCRGCGHDFEKYMTTGTAAVACPSCEGHDITRKLSVFGMKSHGDVAGSMPASGGCCGGGCGCS